MEPLTTAVVIVLLTAASTKPIGWQQRYGADIADNWKQGSPDRPWLSPESAWGRSLQSSESSESSESRSSEESSEENVITDPITPAMTTTLAAITTEPGTMSTDEPDGTVTPGPATTATPVAVTSPSNVTHSVTEEITTADPTTDNRGDN